VSRIFITYRRDDTSSQAGRVYDWLGDHYGREAVFKDVDSIDPGRPWRQAIDTAVGSSDVVIALIGPQWLSELKARDGTPDYVRYELETALKSDRRVIPLLVNGATMPAPEELPETLAVLGDYQAFDLSDVRFRSDMEELLRRLDRVVTPQASTSRSYDHPEQAVQPPVQMPPLQSPPVQQQPAQWPPPQPRPAQRHAGPVIAAPEPDELEAELKKWNWGAFLLTFIWGIGNGVMRSFLVLIPFYGLYEWFMLGIHGNRWAWEKRRWESVEHFHRSQRSWAKAGVIVSVIVFLLFAASSGG
jgi:hypothetical protein